MKNFSFNLFTDLSKNLILKKNFGGFSKYKFWHILKIEL